MEARIVMELRRLRAIVVGLGLAVIPSVASADGQLADDQKHVLQGFSEWGLMDNEYQAGSRAFEDREAEIVAVYRKLPNRLIYDQSSDNDASVSQHLATSVLTAGGFLVGDNAGYAVQSWRCISKEKSSVEEMLSTPDGSDNSLLPLFSCWMPFDKRKAVEDVDGLLALDMAQVFGDFSPFIELRVFATASATLLPRNGPVYVNDVLEMDGLAFCSGLEDEDRLILGVGLSCAMIASEVRLIGPASGSLPSADEN